MRNRDYTRKIPKVKKLTPRQQALADGRKKYATGKPCKYGHASVRLAHNGNCETCQVERSLPFYRDVLEVLSGERHVYETRGHTAARDWLQRTDPSLSEVERVSKIKQIANMYEELLAARELTGRMLYYYQFEIPLEDGGFFCPNNMVRIVPEYEQ